MVSPAANYALTATGMDIEKLETRRWPAKPKHQKRRRREGMFGNCPVDQERPWIRRVNVKRIVQIRNLYHQVLAITTISGLANVVPA